ncbi:hypothetical protein AVEN_24688-1 [Araneus ventricosus]|uniref:Uncharacterized protein n=1 Tax=Araneus ventricosus TaxID=182803 RepID=A0A4Y2VM34_ARAVE|nr:hypothetical protein AVEN_24688-1 [Araneus ventricosus]
MKRQNSFDVTNPAGSDQIEIGTGLQSLHMRHTLVGPKNFSAWGPHNKLNTPLSIVATTPAMMKTIDPRKDMYVWKPPSLTTILETPLFSADEATI